MLRCYALKNTAAHDLYELYGHMCPYKAYKSCVAVLFTAYELIRFPRSLLFHNLWLFFNSYYISIHTESFDTSQETRYSAITVVLQVKSIIPVLQFFIDHGKIIYRSPIFLND